MTEQPEPAATEQPEQDTVDQQLLTEWKFRGKPPTIQQVRDLLATLPPVHGVKHEDFFDFVQALPAKETVKTQHPERPGVLVDEEVDVWTIYMSVAGRLAMLNAAQQLKGWTVQVLPEPDVIPPGYLEFGEKLVYRVGITIHRQQSGQLDPDDRLIGTRHGTAWVPGENRKAAARSNPYEKVETSALGRALAGWGFGVFPGSGIASAEEMFQMRENREYLEAVKSGAEPPPRMSRDELMQAVMAKAEELRQARGAEPEEIDAGTGKYLSERLRIPNVYDDKTGLIDWEKVTDGHLRLLLNELTKVLQKLVDAGSSV
jgi:hypothetical protein